MPLFDWLRRSPASPDGARAGSGSGKECGACRIELPDAARFCFLCGRGVVGDDDSPLSGGDDAVVAALRARLARALDGRYLVHDVLGKGGMGVVFLADDIERGCRVAVKVLRPELSGDETGVARFQREAEIAASLEHPGIIPIHHVGSEQGLHYFVMTHVAGCSLEALLAERRAQGRPLPVAAAVRILSEAAAALGHAHSLGIVHRDVKPGNIMLDDEGQVRLTDFGISKSAAAAATGATTVSQLTSYGTVLGTPHYLAPEQALSHTVDGRADQYALAVVGFEMLAGRVPFDDETPHAIIHHHINEAPPRLAALRPDVPAEVVAALSRAMLKAPSGRFATMDELALALGGGAGPARTRAARVLRAAGVVLLALALVAAITTAAR